MGYTTSLFADAADQDQAAQNVQSDLESAVSVTNYFSLFRAGKFCNYASNRYCK